MNYIIINVESEYVFCLKAVQDKTKLDEIVKFVNDSFTLIKKINGIYYMSD